MKKEHFNFLYDQWLGPTHTSCKRKPIEDSADFLKIKITNRVKTRGRCAIRRRVKRDKKGQMYIIRLDSSFFLKSFIKKTSITLTFNLNKCSKLNTL